MSAISLVAALLDGWSNLAWPYRNILISGEIEEALLTQLLKSVKKDDIRLVSGASFKKTGDMAAILTEIEAHQCLIITGLQDVPKEALESFSSLFVGRQIFIEVGEPPRKIAIDMPNFSLLCIVDPSFRLSDELFAKFDIKISLGSDTQIKKDSDSLSTRNSLTESGIHLEQKIEILISGCNQHGWVDEHGEHANWVFPDGTGISSFSIEYDNGNSWIESYQELHQKVVDEVEGVQIGNPLSAKLLEEKGNLLKFIYVLDFQGSSIYYRFVQFGDGEVAAKEIEIDEEVDLTQLTTWVDEALDSGWEVETN